LVFQKSTENEHWGRGLKHKNVADVVGIADNYFKLKYRHHIDVLKKLTLTHHYSAEDIVCLTGHV